MPRRVVTLSFDDGFRDSFARTADIYEAAGLKACLNIFTKSCEGDYTNPPDTYHNAPVGDWKLWQELAARGHEVMPHGYDHSNHTRIPLGESEEKIDRCLDDFARHLPGFTAAGAVFNFPYNASNEAVEAYLATKVRAWRTGGPMVNPPPSGATRRITCGAFGPGNSEAHLDRHLDAFLKGPGGWFVYNLHGLDEEGWGPVRASYLTDLLERLKDAGAEVLPAAAALPPPDGVRA